MITLIEYEFPFYIFSLAKNDMSFIYLDLWDRERTRIKEKVESRSKYTCLESPYYPAEMTALLIYMIIGDVPSGLCVLVHFATLWVCPHHVSVGF